MFKSKFYNYFFVLMLLMPLVGSGCIFEDGGDDEEQIEQQSIVDEKKPVDDPANDPAVIAAQNKLDQANRDLTRAKNRARVADIAFTDLVDSIVDIAPVPPNHPVRIELNEAKKALFDAQTAVTIAQLELEAAKRAARS